MLRPDVYPETIALIVKAYEQDAPRRELEDAWWRGEGLTFAELIDRVGSASVLGKRHGHQRRLPAAALEGGRLALHRIADQLARAPDFHTLWDLVRAAFQPIPGLGELAVYDTADRLRHRLGLESKHVVYLHAGARVGARRLVGGRLAREDAWGILRHQIPEGLRHLSTHEIEDILCIFKDDLLLSPEQALNRRAGKWSRSACAGADYVRTGC